jgi:RNA polymerase sigma-70 factor (ECF subfamily)
MMSSMISALLQSEVQAIPSESAEALTSIETLYAHYHQRIYRFLLGSVRDHDLAQTLTQDTFIRAWGAQASFRGDCSPSTWLLRIALNLVRDHTRTDRFRFWKRAAESAVEASDLASSLRHPDSSNESRLIAHQQLALVWQTVATLSERQRTVFLLRFVEELELAEIATITAMPVPTVKTHLYRALAIIRKHHAKDSQ